MDELLEQARTIWEGEIDFKGQFLAELASTALLCITGALAFIAGFVTQNILYTLYIGLGGTALTFLVVVPPWPFFNQNPAPFLPAKDQRSAMGSGSSGSGVNLSGVGIEVDGKRVG